MLSLQYNVAGVAITNGYICAAVKNVTAFHIANKINTGIFF